MEEKVKAPIDLGNDLNWGYREPVREMGPTGHKESVETVPSLVPNAHASMNYIKISPL
jgi:hypothetical protein